MYGENPLAICFTQIMVGVWTSRAHLHVRTCIPLFPSWERHCAEIWHTVRDLLAIRFTSAMGGLHRGEWAYSGHYFCRRHLLGNYSGSENYK